MEYKENKVFLPFFSSTLLFAFILTSLFNTNIWEIQKIIIISSLIWLTWLILFILEIKKGNKIAGGNIECIIKCTIIFIISLFFAHSVWFSGYLTLNPVDTIINGNIHHDTVFLCSIAESIKNYGYPSTLVNDAAFLNYHFGSNFIFAILSKILHISVFNVYNFIYPILFIPLYCYLIIYIIFEVRKYKNSKNTNISINDYIFLFFFFVGIFPKFILDRIGIWKESWVISESFLLAVIFFILYMLLFLKVISKYKQHKNIILFFLTIFFIIICSSIKISVGFLLTVSVIYINFRNNTWKIQSWLINIVFLLIFVVLYKIFTGGVHSTENADFKLLAFVRDYAGFKRPLGYILHYLVLLFFTFIVIYYYLQEGKLKYLIISKKIIMPETLIFVSYISLLPGLFMKIDGGSAVYFSYVQELLAIIIILGFEINNKIYEYIQTKNIKIKYFSVIFISIFVFAISINLFYNSRNIFSYLQRIENINNEALNNTIFTNLREVMEKTKNERKYFGIFLDDTAEIWNYDKYRSRTPIFFYPALTGIRLLNAIYIEGDNVYLANGKYLSNKKDAYFGLIGSFNYNEIYNSLELIPKLTLEMAIEKAKNNNMKHIIHIYNNEYCIIDI